MSMKKLFFPVLILAACILLCQPVLGAYAQPYYSHAYQNLSSDQKTEFDQHMKAGDAFYQKGEYLEAVRNYNQAWGECSRNYTAQAAVGQAYLALYNQTKNPGDLKIAENSLNAAVTLLQDENPGGYEQNDLMAKIRTSQAAVRRIEGNVEGAMLYEENAADYRRKANESAGNGGLPLSPVVPLLGLGAAGALVLFRNRK